MLTHLIKSINWIDAALVLLFIRMIFVGVKNGFISEFFKFLGVVTAVFVSLHFYSLLAAQAAVKTNFSWNYWDLAVFAGLWFAVSLFFKFFEMAFYSCLRQRPITRDLISTRQALWRLGAGSWFAACPFF